MVVFHSKECRSIIFHNYNTVYNNYINLQKEASERKEKLQRLFNTYSIRCGTEFMERLHKHLDNFIKQQSHDPAWQKVEVFLSGHLVSIMTKGSKSLKSC